MHSELTTVVQWCTFELELQRRMNVLSRIRIRPRMKFALLTCRYSNFEYFDPVNLALPIFLYENVLVYINIYNICYYRLPNILYPFDFQWTHSVFVKHTYYTSSCSWATVRFLHSWPGSVRLQNSYRTLDLYETDSLL